jgi:hypothetical protein
LTLTDTTGFLALDHTTQAIVLALRGGISARNTFFEFNFILVQTDLCRGCMVEKGFLTLWSAIRAEALQAIDQAIAQNPNYEVIVVGHSLEASLATLAAADVRKRGHPATLYSFGSARVGNRAFAAHVTAQTGNYRITHTVDPVPKLPLVAMGYFHTSPEYWITAPDNTTVQTDEIEVLTGLVNWHGNSGTGFPSPLDFHAHLWYFQNVPLCWLLSLAVGQGRE